jgi:hypothetical protein
MDLYIIYRSYGEYDDYGRYAVGVALNEEQAKTYIASITQEQAQQAQMLVDNQTFYNQFITDNPVAFSEESFSHWNRIVELEERIRDLNQDEEKELKQLGEDFDAFLEKADILHAQWVEDTWKPAYFQFCVEKGRDIDVSKATFCLSHSQGKSYQEDGDYSFDKVPLLGEIPDNLAQMLDAFSKQ